MKEELKNYIGKKVSELPEHLQKYIFEQFPEHDNEYWEFVEVHTWQSFLSLYNMVNWVDLPESIWHMTLEKPVVFKQDRICVVEIDIFDLPDVTCQRSKDNSFALVDWNDSSLIIDADSPHFGYGYIVIKTYPNLKEGELLSLDIMMKEKAIEEAEKRVKQELQKVPKIIIKQIIKK